MSLQARRRKGDRQSDLFRGQAGFQGGDDVFVFVLGDGAGVEDDLFVFDSCDYGGIGAPQGCGEIVGAVWRRDREGAGRLGLARKTASADCRADVDYFACADGRPPVTAISDLKKLKPLRTQTSA